MFLTLLSVSCFVCGQDYTKTTGWSHWKLGRWADGEWARYRSGFFLFFEMGGGGVHAVLHLCTSSHFKIAAQNFLLSARRVHWICRSNDTEATASGHLHPGDTPAPLRGGWWRWRNRRRWWRSPSIRNGKMSPLPLSTHRWRKNKHKATLAIRRCEKQVWSPDLMTVMCRNSSGRRWTAIQQLYV